jgi:PhzF family phenazine biosynthesis protein
MTIPTTTTHSLSSSGKEVPYVLVSAFTNGSDPFTGNPAAVVFLPPSLSSQSSEEDAFPTETLIKIASNLAQPITSFITSKLSSHDTKVARFGIRWFTPNFYETKICGHGTLAAAKAIFSTPGIVERNVEVVEFVTLTAGMIQARKVIEDAGEERLEIQFSSSETKEILGEDRERLVNVYREAFGREDLAIDYIGKGKHSGMESYLLVVIDGGRDVLGGEVKNPEAMVRSTSASELDDK